MAGYVGYLPPAPPPWKCFTNRRETPSVFVRIRHTIFAFKDPVMTWSDDCTNLTRKLGGSPSLPQESRTTMMSMMIMMGMANLKVRVLTYSLLLQRKESCLVNSLMWNSQHIHIIASKCVAKKNKNFGRLPQHDVHGEPPQALIHLIPGQKQLDQTTINIEKTW